MRWIQERHTCLVMTVMCIQGGLRERERLCICTFNRILFILENADCLPRPKGHKVTTKVERGAVRPRVSCQFFCENVYSFCKATQPVHGCRIRTVTSSCGRFSLSPLSLPPPLSGSERKRDRLGDMGCARGVKPATKEVRTEANITHGATGTQT